MVLTAIHQFSVKLSGFGHRKSNYENYLWKTNCDYYLKIRYGSLNLNQDSPI